LSQENISKILCFFPELDANWLLTGKGEMLKDIEEVKNMLNEPEERYGLDYKEMYLREKKVVDYQFNRIMELELELKELNNKRKAG